MVWKHILCSALIGTVVLTGVSFVYLKQSHASLQKQIRTLALQSEMQTHLDIPVAPVIDTKLVTKSEIWRPIQERVKDTVVQVFAQIAEIDILQPYKAPTIHGACGSAFFINEEGELITNAHVVNQAQAVWIQIPSLGKRIIDVDIVGISERDIALLRVCPEDLAYIKKELGSVPYLPLGDSDTILRSDEVLALGYPLSQQSLKSTTGVISGREKGMVQMSAPINPGNSGGPLLNTKGEVIGINTAGVPDAQNVGYIIPINDLKIILADLHTTKLLRTPYLGVMYNSSNEALIEYLGNPQPGGCYVVEVVKGSTLYKAGLQRGDMIYEMDGHKLDMYGDMNVDWSEDKISLTDYVSRLLVGDEVKLVVYRKGQRKEISLTFSKAELPPIRKIYPGYEEIDYEIFAGMIVTPLTINHIHTLAKVAPGLIRFTELQYQAEPVLVITHIFPNSQLYRSRTIMMGSTLNEVNGMQVHTLDDLRNALKSAIGSKFLTLKASDNLARTTDHIFVALPLEKVLEEELRLSHDFKYQLSQTAKELLQVQHDRQQKEKKYSTV